MKLEDIEVGNLYIKDSIPKAIHDYKSVVIELASGKMSEDQFKKLRKVKDTPENFDKENRRF